jgi:FLVCR family MFS transporter 7
VRADFGALLANRNFWPLLVGFGMGLGIFNALLTLLSQLILPCGYGDDDAGSAGAALLVAGLVGAGVAGALLDRTQAFVPLLQGGIVFEVAAIVFLLSSLRPRAGAALIASFGAVGLFLLPLLPLALENAAEATFPVSEDNSASLLLGLGNIVGLLAVFALEPLIAANTCASVFTGSAGLILAVMAAAALALAFFRRDYRRANAAEAST